MKNVNGYLKQKIYDLLNGVISVPVYSHYTINTDDEQGYVVISSINNRQIPAWLQVNTDTSFQISIFTKDTSANPGTLCNTIATEIFSILIPNNNALIDLQPEFQSVSLELAFDNSPDPLATNNSVFINRFLGFRANIYHKQ